MECSHKFRRVLILEDYVSNNLIIGSYCVKCGVLRLGGEGKNYDIMDGVYKKHPIQEIMRRNVGNKIIYIPDISNYRVDINNIKVGDIRELLSLGIVDKESLLVYFRGKV